MTRYAMFFLTLLFFITLLVPQATMSQKAGPTIADFKVQATLPGSQIDLEDE